MTFWSTGTSLPFLKSVGLIAPLSVTFFSMWTLVPSCGAAPGCIALAPFGLTFFGFLYTKRSRKWVRVFKERSTFAVIDSLLSS